MKWELQWEEILQDKLESRRIEFERTSLHISSNLKRYRDYDWDKTINSGQIVELIDPKRKGSKIEAKGMSQANQPIRLGTISFYDDETQYKTGIICQLLTKDLDYANGDTKNCLEFEQPIILTTSDSIPDEILESKTLKVKNQAKSTGCFGVLILLMIAITHWVM